jgi:hypothetical protein
VQGKEHLRRCRATSNTQAGQKKEKEEEEEEEEEKEEKERKKERERERKRDIKRGASRARAGAGGVRDQDPLRCQQSSQQCEGGARAAASIT